MVARLKACLTMLEQIGTVDENFVNAIYGKSEEQVSGRTLDGL